MKFVSINRIQVEEGCYYWACQTCGKIVTRIEVVADVDGHPFNCANFGDISDVFGKARLVIRIQDSTGSSSFMLFDCLFEKLIHRRKAWFEDKIEKVACYSF